MTIINNKINNKGKVILTKNVSQQQQTEERNSEHAYITIMRLFWADKF